MPKYGSAFSGTDTLKRAPGESHDAGVRAYRNLFDLAVDGGTSQALKIAVLDPGVVPLQFIIDSDANLSGVTFKIGTATDDDKYGTAVAGPNATVQVRYPLIATGLTPTSAQEEIMLTPNGNIAGAGSIRTTVLASKR